MTPDPKFPLHARRRLTALIDRLFEGIPNWLLLVAGTAVWTAILLYLTLAAPGGHIP